MRRRTALKNLSSLAAVAIAPDFVQAKEDRLLNTHTSKQSLRKIATEEAFTIPEIATAYREIVQKGGTNLDLMVLKQIYDAPVGQSTGSPAKKNDVSNRDASRTS